MNIMHLLINLRKKIHIAITKKGKQIFVSDRRINRTYILIDDAMFNLFHERKAFKK